MSVENENEQRYVLDLNIFERIRTHTKFDSEEKAIVAQERSLYPIYRVNELHSGKEPKSERVFTLNSLYWVNRNLLDKIFLFMPEEFSDLQKVSWGFVPDSTTKKKFEMSAMKKRRRSRRSK